MLERWQYDIYQSYFKNIVTTKWLGVAGEITTSRVSLHLLRVLQQYNNHCYYVYCVCDGGGCGGHDSELPLLTLLIIIIYCPRGSNE